MKKLFILFFLASCVTTNSNVNLNESKLNFENNLSFDEFEKLLIQYSNTNPYPNIDK